MNSLKRVIEGIISIGDGIASFNICPNTNYKQLTRKEIQEKSKKNIEMYWKNTGIYMERAMGFQKNPPKYIKK